MELSRTDRWLLSNQFRILERLYPDEADYYARARDAIESGYEIEYESYVQNVYEKGLTTEECTEVIDMLSMFQMIKDAQDDRLGKVDVDDWTIKFAGFDGNTETMQMIYTQYLVEGGKFTNIGSGRDEYNSHMPSLDRYRRQLRAWEQSTDRFKLTVADIERIAAAALYPR